MHLFAYLFLPFFLATKGNTFIVTGVKITGKFTCVQVAHNLHMFLSLELH